MRHRSRTNPGERAAVDELIAKANAAARARTEAIGGPRTLAALDAVRSGKRPPARPAVSIAPGIAQSWNTSSQPPIELS